MRWIKLSQGKFTIVDDEDFEWLNQWKWYCSKKGYAVRTKYLGGGRANPKFKQVRMARLILENSGVDITNLQVDHIDRNKLNNQKNNLRPATNSINQHNTSPSIRNKSGYKGVYQCHSSKKWEVRITINNQRKWLGRWASKYDAALAYYTAKKVAGF